ncbi:MAG: GNAT family N-acetyltransferase [Longimicrobiales bacterium]
MSAASRSTGKRATRPARGAGDVAIRRLPRSARAAVERILNDTNSFRADEVTVALEVLDAFFADPEQDYTALGAFSQDGSLLGYVCYGRTPCTLGTWDLYWIAVSPDCQRTGVGTHLLQEVERRLARDEARLVIIETSSQPGYAPTRAFYERHGYEQVARVPDFYAPGDDRLIFTKRLDSSSTGKDGAS